VGRARSDVREGGAGWCDKCLCLLPGVLELGGGLLLDAEDDGVGAADADGGVALADGLERVLHLEEVAVGGEDGDRAVVASHPDAAQ
jgi:hypothetical protein